MHMWQGADLDGAQLRIGALRDARLSNPAQLRIVLAPCRHARRARAPTALDQGCYHTPDI